MCCFCYFVFWQKQNSSRSLIYNVFIIAQFCYNKSMENQQNLQTNKPKLSISFFFLCLGVLISLITSVVSFLNLVFSTLDKRFPDVSNATYQYGYNTYNYETMRIALATLIIFFPIFLIVFHFWKKFTKKEIGHIDQVLKKWLVYVVLFLSTLVVLIDLVTLVKYFVSGEITIRFVYKVLATFVTAVIIGKYFYISEFWSAEKKLFKKINIKKLNTIINPIAGSVLVILAVIWSFSVMGSPMKQRMLRLDDKRVSDLQSIQYQVINYWQQKEKLPVRLVDLANPISGYSLPVDPEFEKGKVYEYNLKDEKNLTFELCADFSLPMPKGWQESQNYYKVTGSAVPMETTTDVAVSSYPYAGGVGESWDHQTGRTCFERTIDKDLYPPFPKVLKN